MSLKAKLISTISAMCLVIALVSVGVWAASTATINLSGTLTFNATDVYCTVGGTFANMSGSITQPDTLTWDSSSTATTTKPTSGDESTWTSKALTFDDKGTAITLTIVVTNMSAERAINITLAESTAPTGVTTSATYNGSAYSFGSTQKLTKSASSTSLQSATIIITFTLTDTNLDTSVSASWGYALTLANTPA